MTDPTRIEIAPKPFLKWVGGKRQLLDELRARVAVAWPYGRYHEPFVGGGALFFDLFKRGALGEMPAYLSDNNPRLIEAYRGVQKNVERLITLLKAHKSRHGEEYFYQVRATVPKDSIARAARLIYLNRTCFNGLYRENSKGEFNVPMGRYKDPLICDAVNLRAVSAALQQCDIGEGHFSRVLEHARKDDLVYFDPPYDPVSKTANFTSYHRDPFGESAQRQLADVYRELNGRGVKLLLSNSDTPLIQSLYKGFKVDVVLARRQVNSRADKRGEVREVLVRNF
jgi:DNA adenine methylase